MTATATRQTSPAYWKVAPGVVWIQVHQPEQARAWPASRAGGRWLLGGWARICELSSSPGRCAGRSGGQTARFAARRALMRDFRCWLPRWQWPAPGMGGQPVRAV